MKTPISNLIQRISLFSFLVLWAITGAILLVTLFLQPTDPKNSFLLGYSLPRLLLILLLLTDAGIPVFILLKAPWKIRIEHFYSKAMAKESNLIFFSVIYVFVVALLPATANWIDQLPSLINRSFYYRILPIYLLAFLLCTIVGLLVVPPLITRAVIRFTTWKSSIHSENKEGLRRTLARLKEETSDWLRAIAPGLVIALLFIAITYFAKIIPDNFFGEDFSLFYFSATEDYFGAIGNYVDIYGRSPEGVFWATTYELFGYQPAIHHVFSIVLNLIATGLGSLVLFRVWPKKHRENHAFSIFFVLAFLNPFTLNWSLNIPGDNSRISIIFFFISALLLQEWAVSKFSKGWFFAAFFFFVIAVLTYENIALLFPATFFLSIPLVPDGFVKNRPPTWTLVAVVLSPGLLLLPYIIYGSIGVESYPAFYGEGVLSGFVFKLFGAFVYSGEFLVNSGLALASVPEIYRFVPFSLLLLVLAAALFFLQSKLRVFKKPSEIGRRFVLIVIGALWLIIFSLLTYAIVYPVFLSEGVSRPVRYFAVPVYGFSALLILVFSLAKRQAPKIVAFGLVLFTILSGFREFVDTSEMIKSRESISIVSNYINLIETVPAVDEGTTFLLVDNEIGSDPWRSCAVSIQMLYATEGLRCIYLSSTDESLRARRSENELFSPEGGVIHTEAFVILSKSEAGDFYIVPLIDSRSDLLIDWIEDIEIRTDYERIKLPRQPDPNGMVAKLLERKQFLEALH